MKFNISYKENSETGESTFKVEGDKVFAEKLTAFIENAQEIMSHVPRLIDRKIKSEGSMGIPFDSLPYTIEMDENLADKIIKANPHLKDKIARAYTSDGNVIGITIIK